MKRAGLLRALWLLAGVWSWARAGERVELVWPTPNPAWANRAGIAALLQHAGSGEPESGGFGGVRSGGSQFHEGIDLKPTQRDRRGEATDPIFAAMDGVVRHISTSAGNSSYGRYIVLEHPELDLGVYTLYAHLSAVAPGLRRGDRVDRGQTIGTMGRSAGGYTIPRDRAHLHFEIGVMITRDFQAWYNARGFGSRNEHGFWNGMNLMGIDALDFYDAWRDRKVDTFTAYFAQLEPVVRLKLATRKIPDFVARYPALLTKPLPEAVVGWEIAFTWTGLPFAWTPLTGLETLGLVPNKPVLLEVNAEVERRQRSKRLAVQRQGKWVPGKDLEVVLQQLFGLP